MTALSVARAKSLVGMTSASHEEEVTAQRVAQLAEVLGGPETLVPGVFLTRLRAGEFELFSKLGLKLEQLLHADQEYMGDSFKVGDRLAYTTRLAEVVERPGRGGRMALLTFVSDVQAASGARATAKSLIIVRDIVP